MMVELVARIVSTRLRLLEGRLAGPGVRCANYNGGLESQTACPCRPSRARINGGRTCGGTAMLHRSAPTLSARRRKMKPMAIGAGLALLALASTMSPALAEPD